MTLHDGHRIDLRGELRVVGDSLVATRHRALPYQNERTERRAIALADIATIEERESRWGLTLLLAVGGRFVGSVVLCGALQCAAPQFDRERLGD